MKKITLSIFLALCILQIHSASSCQDSKYESTIENEKSCAKIIQEYYSKLAYIEDEYAYSNHTTYTFLVDLLNKKYEQDLKRCNEQPVQP
ncbi:MAG: hypothetical protein NTZ68_00650 [Candidatus Dependentiae bacterium]|nr:hypothetical protein [Candidatus Dependentiae bacterium]